MAKLIAKTYGAALFELAVEQDRSADLLKELTVITKALADNPNFLRLLNHPKILKDEKVELVETVFKDKVSAEITGFLRLLIMKDRCGDMEDIFAYFIAAIKDELGIGVATVTTAVALNEIRKSLITERLLSATDYREMEMSFIVDKDIIGGIVFRIGDRVVDASIATRLAKLRKQLSGIQIKNG
ncbi:MAG: F0F1 ATP synthase subunit delta [Lachnospiraceae bacterium]|jgi:F-type H+-transporting ATPase subunit delta|nr:F0F1 ATP synthase subunit delta [Lachnospiraceae bacterium]